MKTCVHIRVNIDAATDTNFTSVKLTIVKFSVGRPAGDNSGVYNRYLNKPTEFSLGW